MLSECFEFCYSLAAIMNLKVVDHNSRRGARDIRSLGIYYFQNKVQIDSLTMCELVDLYDCLK